MSHDSKQQTDSSSQKSSKLSISKVKKAEFHDNMQVRVKTTRHITCIRHIAHVNEEFPIKLLSQDEKNYVKNNFNFDADYLNLKTGEFKMFENKSKDRSQNAESLRRSMNRLRDLINNNFDGDPTKEKFITLTYKENMQDLKRLNNNLDYFIKKLRKEIGHFEYITVIEPQGRGAWHAHILLKSELVSFIPYEIINNCWSNRGFIDIQTLEKVDNIGAYLTAYLTDLEIEGQVDPLGVFVKERKNKKYVKGARLKLYPPKTNIYRTSKGIVMPEEKKMSYKEAKKNAGDHPTFQQTVSLFDENGKTINTIIYEYYNTKRKNVY